MLRVLQVFLLASIATIGAAAVAEAATPPPCFAAASLDPGHAVVGQLVVYRVRIARRSAVESAVLDPPNFSALRAEWLQGRSETVETRNGVDYRIREEHIALIAGSPGRFSLGPATLRCTTVHDGVRQTAHSTVAAVALSVASLPEDGQPAAFAGLVGAPTLIITVTPRSVSLGDTVRVAVLMRGNGNLWDARDPLPALENAEIFRQRPVLRLGRGATLSVARHFIYDVVPRRVGELVIPEIVVPYFDSVANEYSEARASGAVVDVAPRRTLPRSEPKPKPE